MSASYTTITAKGQITLPAEARSALGLRVGQKVAVRVEGDHLVIDPPHDVCALRERLQAEAQEHGTWAPCPWPVTAGRRTPTRNHRTSCHAERRHECALALAAGDHFAAGVGADMPDQAERVDHLLTSGKQLTVDDAALIEVVLVLERVGYGGADRQAKVTQQSNDGGIDGIIDQDTLGLNRVYIQPNVTHPTARCSVPNCRLSSGHSAARPMAACSSPPENSVRALGTTPPMCPPESS